MLSCSTAWSWCVVGCSQAVATQWELNLGEVIRFSLSLCTWYCPSYFSNVPSHTVAHFQQTQTHSDPLLQELCPRTHRSSEGRVHAGLWLDLNNFGLALWSFHFCLLLLCLHPTASPWREKNTADPPCFLHLWWHQSWGSSWPGQEVEQCASSRCASKTVSDQGQCRMEMPKIKTSRGPTFYHFKPSIVFVFVSLWTHQNSSSVSFETELQTQLRFLLLS